MRSDASVSRDRKKSSSEKGRAAEASLNEALTDLEQILEKQRPASDPQAKLSTDTPPGEQYDIPLLHDVVAPAGGVAEEPPVVHRPPEAPKPGSPEYEEACRLLVAKIANEIEVIVQSRIEAALQSATDEIRQQVKNHIEIMLPEILDEIAHERSRKDK